MNILTKTIKAIKEEQEKEAKEQAFENVLLGLKERYSQTEIIDQRKEIADELLVIKRMHNVFKVYVQNWRDPNTLSGKRYYELNQEEKDRVALDFAHGILTGRARYAGMSQL